MLRAIGNIFIGATASAALNAQQDLLRATGTAEAQPSSECDPAAWYSEGFFDTATVDGVRGCIEAGADPMARDEDQNSPLRLAARYTETPAVIQALLAAGSDVEGRNGRGQTPLHGAADSNRNPSVAETLLNAGADPNARGRDEDTPLHVAAAYNLRSGDRRACDASISCWGGRIGAGRSGPAAPAENGAPACDRQLPVGGLVAGRPVLPRVDIGFEPHNAKPFQLLEHAPAEATAGRSAGRVPPTLLADGSRQLGAAELEDEPHGLPHRRERTAAQALAAAGHGGQFADTRIHAGPVAGLHLYLGPAEADW